MLHRFEMKIIKMINASQLKVLLEASLCKKIITLYETGDKIEQRGNFASQFNIGQDASNYYEDNENDDTFPTNSTTSLKTHTYNKQTITYRFK